MGIFKSTRKIRVFDPTSPEYALADSMVSEVFEAYSPEIAYWCFNKAVTAPKLDELDRVYGEASSENMDFLGPFDVCAMLEVNPIIRELTRLGLQQIEEINVSCNVAAMSEYLKGGIPAPGDIFRVSWIESAATRRYVFYTVSNAIPVDMFNFRYINWLLAAEQTPMDEIPNTVKMYYEGR